MTNAFPQNHPGHTGASVIASDSMPSGLNVSGIDRIQILPAIQPHGLTHSVVEGSDDILTTCFSGAIDQDCINCYGLRAIGTANRATPIPKIGPGGQSQSQAQTQAEIVRAKGPTMTPEQGLINLRKLAKSQGWSFYKVYESLPPQYLTDNFLIRLARNDADAILLIKNHMAGLFFNKAARCK